MPLQTKVVRAAARVEYGESVVRGVKALVTKNDQGH